MSSIDVYIVAAARTPIGSFTGSLSKLKASELGTIVIREVIKRAGVEPEKVDEVILGQSLAAGQGQNPARQAALAAGLPDSVPAYSINLLCGSGLKTVVLGCQSIKCGDGHIVICGGQENMSLSPHVMHLRQGVKMGDTKMIDTMIHDGLTDAMYNIHMAITSENLAQEYNISRQQQDEYSVRSQNKAEAATSKGYFKNEIVPVELVDRAGKKTSFSHDEFIRPGTTIEALQKLRPCFKEGGCVTAGNCSGVNDSAAAVMLMSKAEMEKRQLQPLAKIVAWAVTGCQPQVMGIGPVSAVNSVLLKAGWSKDEVDLFELNEATAAQALSCLKLLEIDEKKVNYHGGAIALGHPIGASGCRILVTLLHALQHTGGKKGVASLCIGGGMGIALAVERV